MGDILTLPVPEALHGVYAVAFDHAPADPVGLAREYVSRRVGPPLRELTLGMLDSPLLTLDLRPADEFPPLPMKLLAAYGTDQARLAAVGGASHLLAVRAAYPPGWPPAHEWAARAVAGALGAGVAPVVDVFTPRLLTEKELWRSLPDAKGRTRLVDWMLVLHSREAAGFLFTTRGLGRFGLPELQTEDVPEALVERWGQLLNGLARRLLDLWVAELRAAGRPLAVELSETLAVGVRDVAAAHGAEEEMRREVLVRLRHDTAASGSLLTVLPAVDRPGRAAEQYAALCAGLFG